MAWRGRANRQRHEMLKPERVAHHRNLARRALSLAMLFPLPFACSDPGGDPPPPTWTCVQYTTGCDCFQFRPGWGPNEVADSEPVARCPEAECCALSTEPTDGATAQCECASTTADCETALASYPALRRVDSCPP